MSYNTPVRHLQMGSVLEVGPSGTISILAGGSLVNAGASSLAGNTTIASGGSLTVASGGSIQVASGGGVSVAAVGGFSAPAGITLGGTPGRWAYGTVGLASGVGTVATGLTAVISVQSNVISGVQGGLGSMSSAVADLSLAGSVIFRGLSGSLAFTGSNGTIAWLAFGN